jgi:hypothetical protein
LKVNKITSTKTVIPYEYYDIPFCRPARRREEMENLGEALAGDAITNSPYKVGPGVCLWVFPGIVESSLACCVCRDSWR